ncbi:MAG: hypothetical protein KC505_07435, partial [Myxococcales bacterium]|nr:hypothetical protein [Myxococcales bacterium]
KPSLIVIADNESFPIAFIILTAVALLAVRALAKFNNGFCVFTARAFQWQVNSHGLPSNLI